MTSTIKLGGLSIELKDGTLTIEGLKDEASEKELKLDKDEILKGDVEGNLIVKGNNVKLTIEGDVEGNVVANDVDVHGDIEGNVIGNSVRRRK